MSNLWKNPNVPQKGWTCVTVYDVRGDGSSADETYSETCEMCSKEKIRYVHVMQHEEYEGLNVGCVCACKMSNDYVNPKKKEQQLRNKASRRATWLKRQWLTSREGNLYLKMGSFNVGVFENRWKPGRWSYRMGGSFSQNNYATEVEAKLALFDEFWNSRESITQV